MGVVVDWTQNRPTKPGTYWFYKGGFKRLLQLTQYKTSPQLFTDEHCADTVDDEWYDGGYWYGPIDEPRGPDV